MAWSSVFDLTDGYPAGRVGLWTNLAGVKFQYLRVFQADQPRDVAGGGSAAWSANARQYIKPGGTYTDSLFLMAGIDNGADPILLKGVHLERFQATFSVRRSDVNFGRFKFCFNASDQDDYDSVALVHRNVAEAPSGFEIENGFGQKSVAQDANAQPPVVAQPTALQTDVLWFRVESDATTVKVLCQNSPSKPSDASWDEATQKVFESSNFDMKGGQLGFTAMHRYIYIGNFELKSDGNADGDFTDPQDVVVHRDDFNVQMAVPGGGSPGFSEVIDVNDFESHDAAGNLLYDGVFQFTYDAWNRLVKVTKAYRDPEDSYNLKADMVVNTLQYDALNRRIKKAVSNSGPLDCTYHYYYDGQQIVETHNGSEQVIQQFVWGQTYIDELVQVGLNDDPMDVTEQDIETTYFAMSNANFNVLSLVDDSGSMVERYEYTPYGERQVYTRAGLNDPDCYAPIKKSKRFQVAGVDQPWGLNPVGHQGLFHDQETGLTNNRYRILHSRLGRYIQPDPLGYPDGMNRYEYVKSQPVFQNDPLGLALADKKILEDLIADAVTKHVEYEYAFVTGLFHLLLRLQAEAASLNPANIDVNGADNSWHNGVLTLKYGAGPPQAAHELIHVMLTGKLNPRPDEGIGYSYEHIEGNFIRLQFLEKMLYSDEKVTDRNAYREQAAQHWRRTWKSMNTVIGSDGWYEGRWGSVSFNITPGDVSNLRKYTGFATKCQDLADKYNNSPGAGEKKGCLEFRCTTGAPYDMYGIWVIPLENDLNSVFQ